MKETRERDNGKTREPAETKMRVVVSLAVCFAIMLAVAWYFFEQQGKTDRTSTLFMYNAAQSSESASRMKVDLLKSVELEKMAVMAVTDQDSRTFADQSRKASDAVESGYLALRALIEAGGIGEELRLIQEFGDAWKDFRAIDTELLKLAVENTNIKAANLSHTKGAESIDRFERAMRGVTEAERNSGTALRVTNAACQAMTAALRIYSLQAPHINEAQDRGMDEIESTMRTHEEWVKRSLHEISLLVAGRKGAEDPLQAASAAFDDFLNVNKEVLRLSRLNSNVRSLQLSLGRKLQVTSQCAKLLDALQDAIQHRTLKATK